jgi:NADP-dependent 3-hydroxy acid dehydrogenase YdfG
VAVVTGASQGIGRAVAYRLAHNGYLVWAVARRAERLEELAESAPKGHIRPSPVDLTAPDLAVLEDALAEAGAHVDTVVHCAGVITTGSLMAADPHDALRLMHVNALSPLRLTNRLRPRLGSGSTVVFVNSSQGLSAPGGAGAYAASKHALKAIADALRSDLTGSGIRVTSIYPGRTATPMQARLYAERDEVYRPEFLLQPDAIAQLVHTVITLPAGAEVTDISVRPALKSY